MSRYYRDNPDEEIRHDWTGAEHGIFASIRDIMRPLDSAIERAKQKKPVQINQYKEVVIEVSRGPYSFPVEVRIPWDRHKGKIVAGLPDDGMGAVVNDVYAGSRYQVENGNEKLAWRSGEFIGLTDTEMFAAGDKAKAELEGK
jgi:hypothetical protein